MLIIGVCSESKSLYTDTSFSKLCRSVWVDGSVGLHGGRGGGGLGEGGQGHKLKQTASFRK